eukprot:4783997-Amphidinium_carterae.1
MRAGRAKDSRDGLCKFGSNLPADKEGTTERVVPWFHHNPKAPWCLVCQMVEATPYKPQSLKRTEIGCLSIDIAGPLIQAVTKSRYIVVVAWVTIGPHRGGLIGPRKLQTGGELKRDLKQREVVLPFY